ncbi:divalent cation transporter [Flavobacteriaceae bacterium]|nr:divalent cation transporter [Flavobacteriaceae bacterium]
MIGSIILYSGIAGITVFIGGLFAKSFDHQITEGPVKSQIIHSLMAFGAGIILSALVFVLIPSGMDELGLSPMVFSFLLGAIIFMILDGYLAKKGAKTATLLAMLMDFIPESLALGAVFALDIDTALLLSIFIGLQNLPEAFNAYRDLTQGGFKSAQTLWIFFGLSFVGVVAALAGHLFLSQSPVLTSYLMTFASGGIFYLLIQDIIPESKLQNNFITAFGAVLGFVVGILGEKII